jgi:hypothetical protein
LAWGGGIAPAEVDDVNGSAVEHPVSAIKAAKIMQTLVLSFIAVDFM